MNISKQIKWLLNGHYTLSLASYIKFFKLRFQGHSKLQTGCITKSNGNTDRIAKDKMRTNYVEWQIHDRSPNHSLLFGLY